jgi:AraC-like DNA-binding protein
MEKTNSRPAKLSNQRCNSEPPIFMLPNILVHQPVKNGFKYDYRDAPMPLEYKPAYRVRQSREFIERHFNQPIKIPVLAAQAAVSVSYFFKLFGEDVGCTPLVYLTRLRIERACELLITTASSVKVVAIDIGYNDPLYFSRVFKSLVGVAPQTYRRLKKNGGERNIPEGVKDNFRCVARG